MATKTTPQADAAPEAAAPNTTPAPPATDSTPHAGGNYTRDPVTGVLTLVTPSTIQE